MRLIDPTALREAVINAIIHNEYTNGIPPVFEIFADGFVITSSGGLPQELNQAEFFDGISAPRNKELIRVFKDVKLVEQLGSGVQRMLKMYDRSIFKFSSNFLKVSFPMENVGENAFKLNSTQKKIINLVKLDKHVTQADLSKQLNKSVRTIERNMKTLQKAKIITRIGSNTTGYWEVLK